MNSGTYGVPRPYGFSAMPRAPSRFLNPTYAATYPATSGTPYFASSPAFAPSQRAPFAAHYGVGLTGFDFRQTAPPNSVNALPYRLAYPTSSTITSTPQNGFPFIGAAMPPVVANSERAVQPPHSEQPQERDEDHQDDSSASEHKVDSMHSTEDNAATESDGDDEEEIDVVGGLEDDDEEVDSPLLTEERAESEGGIEGEDEMLAQEDRESDAKSSESEREDDEEDEGAASSEDENSQDGTVEEDGHFVGEYKFPPFTLSLGAVFCLPQISGISRSTFLIFDS